jgi:hypothetical protein
VILWFALYLREDYGRVGRPESHFRLLTQLVKCIPLDRVTNAPAKDADPAFDILPPEDVLERLSGFCADACPNKELGKLHHKSVGPL